MGDHNNIFKFGPEWLRNITYNTTPAPRSRSSSAANNVATTAVAAIPISSITNITSSGAPNPSPTSPQVMRTTNRSSSVPAPSQSPRTNSPAPSSQAQSSKVSLAKLRYGREEMLALYDRSVEATAELKSYDLLYNMRRKSPIALNNFEEESRENVRPGPSNAPPGERFNHRGVVTNERGRSRGSVMFVRNQPSGRWQNSNTNWRRQHLREEGPDAEWRMDSIRPRAPQSSEKWVPERDRNERGNRHSGNRRLWVETDEDHLPEWAIDNGEGFAGSFDSSGAFHGYSNDDSNLPTSSGDPYPLMRSQTHGCFSRTKSGDEGSEEWWASEKAKKLSPKKFDATEIKFKKSAEASTSQQVQPVNEVPIRPDDTMERGATACATEMFGDEPVQRNVPFEYNEHYKRTNKRNVIFNPRMLESKTFDALMRSDINVEEANDERSNFNSVMITPNNSLRQKHQNIVSSTEAPKSPSTGLQSNLLHIKTMDNAQGVEDLVDNMEYGLIEMHINDENIVKRDTSQIPTSSSIPFSNGSIYGMPSVNSLPMMSNPPLSVIQNCDIANQGMPSAISTSGIPNLGNPPRGLPLPGTSSMGLHPSPINMNNSGIPNSAMQPVAMSLPRIANVPIVSPLMMAPGVTPPGISNFNTAVNPRGGIAGTNNNSLFLEQAPIAPANGLHTQSGQVTSGQTNIYTLHGLQTQPTQNVFNNSLYSNVMHHPITTPPPSLADQWFYEDPEKNIQGPFTPKEMYDWYGAGFFAPNLMVRRSCETMLRPLGSYGPIPPFVIVMTVPNLPNISVPQYNNVGNTFMQTPQNQMFSQQPMMESLWRQPTASDMWGHQSNNDSRMSNVNLYTNLWDQIPTVIASNSLLPEEIVKEMKTEDQILAQLRASQNMGSSSSLSFLNPDQNILPSPSASTLNSVEEPKVNTINTNVGTNTDEFDKLIQKDAPISDNSNNELAEENLCQEPPVDTITKPAVQEQQNICNIKQKVVQTKTQSESKQPKPVKVETNEKYTKNKETSVNKNKNKTKLKEDKKEELVEPRPKEENPSKADDKNESSPSPKNKKEDKLLKKESEKDKKDCVKASLTPIIKEATKVATKEKENKKKIEEVKEDKKQTQKSPQQQSWSTVLSDATKKAPWSPMSNENAQGYTQEGLTLAEIQKLEREKKLEQIKEQQQMMLIIAQQQQAALAREQEMQMGLGWAKKKGMNANVIPGQSLTQIQAETRKQSAAAAAAAAAAHALEESLALQATLNQVPWSSANNGGGFWDTQNNAKSSEKQAEQVKINEIVKPKKKPASPTSKSNVTDTTHAQEFDSWCSTVLAAWSTKIDVPTFISFLKDIESPYEVKDYVKCYLGETKDSNDFSRSFLERRSKMMRVGTVTPVDDLCSPAAAVTPRTLSGVDHLEAKGKGKKTKKNKMLKVDARILGFSVTASEDRINVGDIEMV